MGSYGLYIFEAFDFDLCCHEKSGNTHFPRERCELFCSDGLVVAQEIVYSDQHQIFQLVLLKIYALVLIKNVVNCRPAEVARINVVLVL